MDVWRLEHPSYIIEQKHRRRARKLAAGGTCTRAEIDALFEAQHRKCANPYCRCYLTLKNRHLDHRQALARGGSNAITNMQFLCGPCNQRKNALDELVWLTREAARAAKVLGVGVDEVHVVFGALPTPAPSAINFDDSFTPVAWGSPPVWSVCAGKVDTDAFLGGRPGA